MAAQYKVRLVTTSSMLALVHWALFVALSALGTNSQAQTIVPQTQGRVSFISGGVGREEVCQLKGVRQDYNLHLLFAEKPSNQFLADILVTILDDKGNVVLETRSEGPYLYAHLEPGRYKVQAENGNTTKSKYIDIRSYVRATSVSFLWQSAEPRPPRVRVDALPHC